MTTEQQENLRGTSLTMLYALSGQNDQSINGEKSAPPFVWRSPQSLVDDLRQHLARRLPEYMLPHHLSLLEHLPLTHNGKIDVRALVPASSLPVIEEEGTEPQTPNERRLALIWSQLLGLSHVGVHTSFFELGGDSILCIQMIGRARRAGLHLTPSQVFEHRTIARLSKMSVAGVTSEATLPRSIGFVPLTPIQRWFFDLEVPNRNYWNQSVLMEFVEVVPMAVLQKALDAVANHHDAFRLRFHYNGRGWEQSYASSSGPVPLLRYPAVEEAKALTETHRSLDLHNGPLFRGALIEETPDRPARLLLVAHHLIIDAVSWRIVLEDLAAAARQITDGKPFELSAIQSTYQQWADWINRQAPRLKPQSVLARPTMPLLPHDFDEHKLPSESSSAVVSAFLS